MKTPRQKLETNNWGQHSDDVILQRLTLLIVIAVQGKNVSGTDKDLYRSGCEYKNRLVFTSEPRRGLYFPQRPERGQYLRYRAIKTVLFLFCLLVLTWFSWSFLWVVDER